jgi:hypothetical protein
MLRSRLIWIDSVIWCRGDRGAAGAG